MKKALLALLLVASLIPQPFLARRTGIAFDASANSSANSPAAGAVTWTSGSIASGATMFVCTYSKGADNTTLTADGSSTGVGEQKAVFNATAILIVRLWSITGLSSGTHTLSFVSVAPTYAAGADISLTGVKATSFIGDSDSAAADASNAAFTAMVPTATDSAIVDCVGTNQGGGMTMNTVTGRTERANFVAKDANQSVGMSTLIPTGSSGSNIAMGWNDGTNEWGYVGVEVLAETAPSGGTPPFVFVAKNQEKH